MGVDTRLKRMAAVTVGAPIVPLAPLPDASVTFADRIVMAGVYPELAERNYQPFIFKTAGAFQVKPHATGRRGPGIIRSFTVVNVGTNMTVDVYDSDSTEENKLIEYVTADGKVNWNWQSSDRGTPGGLRLQYGLRVVIGGTPGRVIIDFE